MSNISIHFNETVGPIKPMHAVGQPPFSGGFASMDFSPMNYLKEANIPYARLHDVGGPFGGGRYVDIPNIFRNFDADVEDPESYDFAFTDVLLAGMAEYDVEPIFRLGVTIENQSFIKAYHIHPPKDYDKWARICEHIIRHYNEGWANGFHYGITYWEIWNEPDNRPDPKLNQMWTGSAEDYYRLYDVAAKHLKACFGDSIKVGGYASCGFYHIYGEPEKYGMQLERMTDSRYTSERAEYRMKFLYGFFDYIKEHQSPIDFFSWHSYSPAKPTAVMAQFLERFLEERGYAELETMLNEWNYAGMYLPETVGSSYQASEATATMILMQDTKTDMLCYYDAKMAGIGRFAGMFNGLTRKPFCLYYAFYAFGQLYALGTQAKCETDHDELYALAATDGNQKAVLMTYMGEGEIEVTTEFEEGAEVYLVDEAHMLEKVDYNAANFTLKQHQVVFIKA
jgi:hypothetical protein